MQKEPMTQYGFEKLSSEMSQIKNIELPGIAKEIESALEHGDLKENSEYHAAKEKQRLADMRLGEVGDILSRAQIVNPEELEHARVSFGSTIVLSDVDTDEEITYTIVGGCESNPDMGLISFNSPLAKQLLGKEEGDEFKAQLPGGIREFEVLEVKYQEIVFESH
ncbi:MAG TPA: transcription elongation factor GreA [Helicobacteraceae bacterium]|nr:transcription elongation factor GreA [Helicobacteraceae bacterium]